MGDNERVNGDCSISIHNSLPGWALRCCPAGRVLFQWRGTVQLKPPDGRDPDAEATRSRLSRLSEATLRINESLDFDSVLQQVVDSARVLTDSRYGVITTVNDSGQPEDFLTSGMTPEERLRLEQTPERMEFFEHLSGLPETLGIADFRSHTRLLGLPELRPLSVGAFLAVPIRHVGEGVGNIYLGRDEDGREFDREDEDTLVMFAAQAALVIANARRYRDEQQARAGLEALIDTSPVGVAVFDAGTGAPVSYNRETVRIMEQLRLPDRPLQDLLELLTVRRPDGQEFSLADVPASQLLRRGETLRAVEMELSVPDGRSVTVLVNVTPMRSEDGKVESALVTMQDMTPLEELQKLRAEFLGMVSHELRVPLTSIKGSADTLLESLNSLDPTEVVQFVRIIKSQADRMRDLISELLDVARIETGTLSVAPEPTTVFGLVDEAKNTFLSGGGRRTLTLDVEPDLPRVLADRRRIVQVLSNLLTNAARYSRESSPIRVSASLVDGYCVAISVIDEGRGVLPEDLPSLFRKFSRIEDGSGDTGLGLAICKGIVEAHGGRIWAESEGVGLGTRFTFTIPVADGVVSPAASRAPLHSAGSWQENKEQVRVLAVDDDPMVLRYLRDALTQAGYLPIVTTDPGEALRLVDTERPNLVLLDLLLPGSDGIELMQSILGIAQLPVLFLSAYGRDEVIARAFEAGAVDYMVKPFSPTELVARVRSALRRQSGPVQAESIEPFLLGDLTVNYADRAVSVAGRPVYLTVTEYELLVELSANAGRVLTHEALLDRVWGTNYTGGKSAVRTAVKRLRDKLGDDANAPTYIFAEPRVGYRMAKGGTQEDSEPRSTS